MRERRRPGQAGTCVDVLALVVLFAQIAAKFDPSGTGAGYRHTLQLRYKSKVRRDRALIEDGRHAKRKLVLIKSDRCVDHLLTAFEIGHQGGRQYRILCLGTDQDLAEGIFTDIHTLSPAGEFDHIGRRAVQLAGCPSSEIDRTGDRRDVVIPRQDRQYQRQRNILANDLEIKVL